jgi:hypothetical protein
MIVVAIVSYPSIALPSHQLRESGKIAQTRHGGHGGLPDQDGAVFPRTTHRHCQCGLPSGSQQRFYFQLLVCGGQRYTAMTFTITAASIAGSLNAATGDDYTYALTRSQCKIILSRIQRVVPWQRPAGW